MNKPSENKVTKTNTIDKSKQTSAAPTNPTKNELSEQELDKATGGAVDMYKSFPGKK
jgi:hypothetical protein